MLEKTSMGNILGKIPYSFSTAYLPSTYTTVFSIKNKFTGYFDFLLWFSSTILLSKMKSLFLNLYTSPLRVTSLLQLRITTGSVY